VGCRQHESVTSGVVQQLWRTGPVESNGSEIVDVRAGDEQDLFRGTQTD
jgi:hypothetical protein